MLRVAWTERRNNEDDTAADMGNERRLVIITESYKTEYDNFRARDEGERSIEGDDVGVRRREEKERTAEENMDEGDAGRNGDEPGGTETSVVEKELVEDAVYMKVAKIHRINSTRYYMITGIDDFSQILSVFLVMFSVISFTV